jgi:hypothetical protein
MKAFILTLLGVLGMTLAAPTAQARDHHRSDHHRHHYQSQRHYSYPRSYPSRSYGQRPRYYAPRQYYSSYRDPYLGDRYYYSRRPVITFGFGL